MGATTLGGRLHVLPYTAPHARQASVTPDIVEGPFSAQN